MRALQPGQDSRGRCMAAPIGRCGSRCAPTLSAQPCRRSPRSARTAPHGAVPPRHCPQRYVPTPFFSLCNERIVLSEVS